MPKDHAPRAVAASRATGFAGSALIALGGLTAGALPAGSPVSDGVRQHADAGLVCVYTGLVLLLAGWWWYGQATRDGPADTRSSRAGWLTLALWAAPLLLAPPMFSRDVYSYLAQGLMLDAGLDVYRYGPAVLGGPVAAEVPAVWQHTPSPYGPVFLMVAEAVTDLTGSHLGFGILAMRFLAVVGLALLAAAVPVLARVAGVDPAAALWLAALNPLVLIHLVGGAHNDALMVGLLTAGLAAAVRRRPVVATLLIVAAALIKVPAVLGLVAVGAIWAAQLSGRWRRLRAASAVTATAAGATVLSTAIAGTGYGWVGALDTPISPHNWSLTGALGRLTADLLTHDEVGAALAVNLWRGAGLTASAVVAVLVWTYGNRWGPVHGLGIVFIAVVALGPALRPWYVVWGLVPLAVASRQPRARRLLALLCAALALVVLPDGFAAEPAEVLSAVVGGLVGGMAFLAVRLAVSGRVPRPVVAAAESPR